VTSASRATTATPVRSVAALRSGFERDGWVVVPALLSADECVAVVDADAGRQWPVVSDALRPWIFDARWLATLEGLGAGGRAFREQLVTKAPHAETRVPWHQDAAYLDAAPAFTTIFVALEAIDERNGCLRMQPGSHRRGLIEHRPCGYVLEAVDAPSDEGVSVTLAPGDAVVFGSSLLHQSLGNHTATRRLAWMLQFRDADA